MKHGNALGRGITLAERLGEHRVDALAALFRDVDGERVGSLDLLGSTTMVPAEIPAPEGAPTALVALMPPFLIALTT